MKKYIILILILFLQSACVEGFTRARSLQAGRQSAYLGASGGVYFGGDAQTNVTGYHVFDANIGYEIDVTDQLGGYFFMDNLSFSSYSASYGAQLLVSPFDRDSAFQVTMSPGISMRTVSGVTGFEFCGGLAAGFRSKNGTEWYTAVSGFLAPKAELGAVFEAGEQWVGQSALGLRWNQYRDGVDDLTGTGFDLYLSVSIGYDVKGAQN